MEDRRRSVAVPVDELVLSLLSFLSSSSSLSVETSWSISVRLWIDDRMVGEERMSDIEDDVVLLLLLSFLLLWLSINIDYVWLDWIEVWSWSGGRCGLRWAVAEEVEEWRSLLPIIYLFIYIYLIETLKKVKVMKRGREFKLRGSIYLYLCFDPWSFDCRRFRNPEVWKDWEGDPMLTRRYGRGRILIGVFFQLLHMLSSYLGIN